MATDLEKLTKYRELLAELEGLNSIYPSVRVKIPPETVITEHWSNGLDGRFTEFEFELKDIDRVNKKLTDRIRYQNGKETKDPS